MLGCKGKKFLSHLQTQQQHSDFQTLHNFQHQTNARKIPFQGSTVLIDFVYDSFNNFETGVMFSSQDFVLTSTVIFSLHCNSPLH